MFDFVANSILPQLTLWAGVGNQVVAMVTGLVVTGATIQMMWFGFNLLRGAGGNNHLLDLLAKSARVFMVMTFALAGSAYTENVIGIITELRTGFSNLFVGSADTSGGSYAALDVSVGKAIDAMRSMMPWVADNTNILVGNFTGLIGFAGMAFMVGLIVVYAVICAANLLLIDFGFTVIWAVGPFFVACFAFESTARFFDAWLGGAMKYAFTAVVVAAVIGMGVGILDVYCTRLADATQASTIDFIGATCGALGAIGVLVFFSSRASEIAGNIVGGIGISAIGPAMAAGPLAAISSMMGRGARGAANAAGAVGGVAASRVISTAPGQKALEMAQAVGSSAPAQKAVEIAQAAGRFGSAVGNMQPGSVRAAYNYGGGRSAGLGSITGGGRPPGRPAGVEE